MNDPNDIVTRLLMRPTIVRKDQFGSLETDRAATQLFDDVHALMREAADEITRLRDYRLARAPERRVFYIDVGNLPRAKAEQYLKEIMNRYREDWLMGYDTPQSNQGA